MAQFLNILGQIGKSKSGEVPVILKMRLNKLLDEAKKDAKKISIAGNRVEKKSRP